MSTLKNFQESKYSIYAYLSIVAVIVFALSVFLLIPTTQNIFTVRDSLKQNRTDLETLTGKLNLLKSIAAGSITNFSRDAQKALPNEKSPSAIMNALDNLSINTQIGIDGYGFTLGMVSTQSAAGVTAPAAAKTTGADVININIKTRGTADQFKKFVTDMQHTRPLFDISSINVNFLGDANKSVASDLTLLAYYQTPITRIGSTESILPEFTETESKLLQSLTDMPDLAEMLASQATGAAVTVGKSDLFSF